MTEQEIDQWVKKHLVTPKRKAKVISPDRLLYGETVDIIFAYTCYVDEDNEHYYPYELEFINDKERC